MRNKSVQEGIHSQLTKTSQGVVTERSSKNQFRPSQSLFNIKKVNYPQKYLNYKGSQDTRSTPFIKSRMEALLKTYEMGHHNEKYSKEQI